MLHHIKDTLLRSTALFAGGLALLVSSHTVRTQTLVNREGSFTVETPRYSHTFEIRPANCEWGTLAKTRDGFVWLGGPEGLFRFDGQDVRKFAHPENIGDAKLANHIRLIHEDRAGTLWLGTPVGLQIFDRKSERFIRLPHTFGRPDSSIKGSVLSLCEDSSGTLWVGTAQGLYHLSGDSGKFQRKVLDLPVISLCRDRSGVLWIGTSTGLWCLDYGAGMPRFVAGSRRGSFTLSSDTVTTLLEDRSGQLWVDTPVNIHRVDASRTHSRQYGPTTAEYRGLPEDVASSIALGALGIVWIALFEDGVAMYDPDTDSFVQHKRFGDESISQGLANVGRIFAEPPTNPDPQRSVLWIRTASGGLGTLVTTRVPYSVISGFCDSSIFPISIMRAWIRCISTDPSGIIWAGTLGNGLYRLDPRTARYEHLFDPNAIVTALLFDRDGTFWVRCGTTLYQYNTRQGRFQIARVDSSVFLVQSRDGRYWSIAPGINDLSHLISFMDPSEPSRHHSRPRSDSAGSIEGGLSSLVEDNRGQLWFGTGAAGLTRFDPRTGEYRRYLSRRDDPTSLASNTVRAIIPDESGILWVGGDNGLQSFDPVAETFTSYPWPQAPGVFVRGMADDGRGHLWLALGGGVVRFTKSTHEYRTFIPPGKNRISRGIHYDPTTGRVYTGYWGALLHFRPEDVDEPRTIPPVAITSLTLFDKDYRLPYPQTSSQRIILPYFENTLSFSLAVLDWGDPDRNQYSFKLEGVDHEWFNDRRHLGGARNVPGRRSATYANLSPGEYTFRTQGGNSAGAWNQEGASLTIVITPPWWKTPWAYIGYSVVTLLVLYGLRRYDHKRVMLKQALRMEKSHTEKLEEIDSMKMRFFANISHEFRTPLTLVLGPVERLLKKPRSEEDQENLHIVRRNALRLLELINQLLDISKLDAGKMQVQVQLTDIAELLRILVVSFASLAERKQIELFCACDETSVFAYVDRDKIQKIVTNLLSNAFKFTPAGGSIRVEVAITGDENGEREGRRRFAEITVADSGIGIPADKIENIFHRFYQVDDSQVRLAEGTGIGLALTKELVELHHGHITVKSKSGEGSTFRVRLPLGKEHWNPEDLVQSTPLSEALSPEVDVPLRDGSKLEQSPEEVDDRTIAPTPCVLIVEDNADVRTYLHGSLNQYYRVEEAKDGREGLETAIRLIPDLVLSDIMMPHINGVELCRHLKADERTSHIPVILLTARATDRDKLEGLETGADDYIIKPFDVQELLVRIKNLIDLRKALQEKYRRHCVLEPGDIPIENEDERFLQRAMSIVNQHLSEVGFETSAFAEEMCMSRMQLNRKLHALTGQSTHQFVRNLRLQRAAKLFDAHWGNVTEVAYEVGFSSLSSFAKAFRSQYHLAPSEYAARATQSLLGQSKGL